MREAEGPVEIRRPVHVEPRASGLALRQPTFDWEAQDKYNPLNSFKIEVRKIFMMNS